MHKKFILSVCCIFILGFSSFSTEDSVSIDTINNHNGWGWEALVVSVSPELEVQLAETVSTPELTKSIELYACNVDSPFIECIDKVDISTDDSFIAYKAAETPVIDGDASDVCWDTVGWYPINFVWLPYDDYVTPEDFTGRFKLSWTDERLLLLVEVVDNILNDGHFDPLQNYWDDDCVEVFLDEDHSGGNHLYNFNAFAYHVSTVFDVVDNNQSGPALFNSHIDAARNQMDSLYTWELSIKIFDSSYVDESSIPVTLTNAKEMGFSLAYCDNDGSPSRENFIGSKYLPENESNNSYINASLFGTLTLIDPEYSPDIAEPFKVLKQENLKVYPNPASEALYYWFDNNPDSDYQYRIVDLTGQTILNRLVTKNIKEGIIDLSGLHQGTYIIYFQNTDNIISKQIILL